MTDQQRFREKRWGQVVARAWADEGFKRRLTADPVAVLREHGIEVAPGAEVRVVEDTPAVTHFVLPPSPAGELCDEELSPTAGADSFSHWCHSCARCARCGCGRCGCGCDAF